jgi:hypothetical protein
MGVVESKQPTDVEYPPPPLCICTCIQPECKPCSHLGRVVHLNDPPARLSQSAVFRGKEADVGEETGPVERWESRVPVYGTREEAGPVTV